MNNKEKMTYKFAERFLAEATLYDGLYLGRVVSQYSDLYKVVCEDAELLAEVSGKFRFETKRLSDFPAVGDFVMIDRPTSENGNAIIHHVLTRKSAFVRKAAGTSNDEQVVAANIDVVFICMSLNNDFSLRRLERYLSIAWSSGANPVVVLTKADLCDDEERILREVNQIAIGADILVTSAWEDNYGALMDYVKKDVTVAFIGSSGVGKSTLINCLLGENKIDTQGLRSDDKGRHTTTRRELFFMDNGAMLIDTPGMRELGLENADLSKSFADIDELASTCKFSDCTHSAEPGCAVQRAIADGTLSLERLLSYQKLKKENKYDGLNSKQIEEMKINEMFGGKNSMKKAMKQFKNKHTWG